jgi:hypothetical protein
MQNHWRNSRRSACLSRAVLAGALLCAGGNVGAESYVAALYSHVNIDYKPFPDAEGVNLMASLEVLPRLDVFARFNTTEFRPSGPELGRYRTAENWAAAGVEYSLLKSDKFGLGLGAALHSVTLDNDRETGHSFHLAAYWRPLSWLNLSASLGQLDLVIDDITAIARAGISLTPNLAWDLRIEDHSDWDFTAYETGLRWSFGKSSNPEHRSIRPEPAPPGF